MNHVYLVLHGETVDGANPGLNERGKTQIKGLLEANYLPTHISMLISNWCGVVVCGTGRRHLETAQALELAPTRYASWAGDADCARVVDGRKAVILGNGSVVEIELYTTLDDLAPVAKAQINALPDDAIVICGRPLGIMLGKPDAKSATIYKLVIDSDDSITWSEVVSAM